MSTKKNTAKKNNTIKNTIKNNEVNNNTTNKNISTETLTDNTVNEDKHDNNMNNNTPQNQDNKKEDELILDLGNISDNNEAKTENNNHGDIKGSIENNNKYYTTHQVSKLVGVTPATIIAWINSGKVKCVKTLGGHRRIKEDTVNELLSKIKNSN